VTRLYRLAFEKAELGAIYHAVGEEGVSLKAIAEAIGRGLKVPVASIKPEDAEAHFGSLAMFVGLDLSASSAITRKKLNWKPTGPGLIADPDLRLRESFLFLGHAALPTFPANFPAKSVRDRRLGIQSYREVMAQVGSWERLQATFGPRGA
jgi:hypothetical protein